MITTPKFEIGDIVKVHNMEGPQRVIQVIVSTIPGKSHKYALKGLEFPYKEVLGFRYELAIEPYQGVYDA